MSSDSSEDENLELIKEAANNEFFPCDLFNAGVREKVTKPCESLRKQSLRHQEDENLNDLKVTPEFQKHVASHLMKLLESQIKEVKKATKCKTNGEISGGIKLLNNSSELLSCEENVDLIASNIKRKRFERPISQDIKEVPKEKRIEEAAVSAEWILSQKAVMGWEPCTKGKIETYQTNEVELPKQHVATFLKNSNCNGSSQNLTSEEEKEKKRLKRKRCRERLKQKNLTQKKELSKGVKEIDTDCN